MSELLIETSQRTVPAESKDELSYWMREAPPSSNTFTTTHVFSETSTKACSMRGILPHFGALQQLTKCHLRCFLALRPRFTWEEFICCILKIRLEWINYKNIIFTNLIGLNLFLISIKFRFFCFSPSKVFHLLLVPNFWFS